MAVEIKELVIRAVAVEREAPAQAQSRPALDEAQVQQIIQAAVQEALRLMQRKQSR